MLIFKDKNAAFLSQPYYDTTTLITLLLNTFYL